MACVAPLTVSSPHGPILVRCKQCLGCRIHTQSSLTLRGLLENQSALSGLFVTMTYREEPETPTYSDFQTFLKRVREWHRRQGLRPSIRYLGCGEYGEKFGRFHFHGLLWNTIPPFDPQEVWPYGFVHTGQVTPKSINYTVRYTLKFLPQGEKPIVGWSRFPPLGGVTMRALGERYLKEGHVLAAPPDTLSMNGRSYPVDRILKIEFAEGYAPHWIVRDALGTRSLVKSVVCATMNYREVKMFGDPLADYRASQDRKSRWWETVRISNGKL